MDDYGYTLAERLGFLWSFGWHALVAAPLTIALWEHFARRGLGSHRGATPGVTPGSVVDKA